MSKRRPKTFQSCPGLISEDMMVMEGQVEITYHMETNRASLEDEEAQQVLGYLREDLLQSLINAHCPKTGQRNRDRPVGSRASESTTGLEALSIHAGAPQLLDSNCPMTHADTLSCRTYSNDIQMLFDSVATREQLEADILNTIEQFMTHNFYTNQVNLRLAGEGSTLHVTGFQFQQGQNQPTIVRESETLDGAPPNTENFQNESLNIAKQQQSVESDDGNQVSSLTILMAVLAAFLFLVLLFVLGHRCLESWSKGKSSQSVKSKSMNNTLRTREDTLIEADDESESEDDQDQDSSGSSEANSDGYQPSKLEDDSELVHYVEVDKEGRVVEEPKEELAIEAIVGAPKEELPIHAILGDLSASMKQANKSGAPSRTVITKCSNTRCKACSKAPDDDPTYLCPNYRKPWGNEGTSSEKEVSLRVFEEESQYHDRADDTVISRGSISVIPPSRVNQARSQSILHSFSDQNSVLASDSEEAAADEETIEKIVVIAPGQEPTSMQRTLRPARTVQL